MEVSPSKIRVYHYRISEIFNPHVSKDLKSKLNDFGPVVLANCRIAPRKGLHFLIAASRTIVARVPNAMIVIRGSARNAIERNYKKYLLVLINKYNLNEHIKIIDEYIPYTDLPKYLVCADVYVLPSLDESLGISILEALACGVPVVATTVGGIPEIVAHKVNGILVEPRDFVSMAEAIVYMIEKPEIRETFSKAAIHGIELLKNDWEGEFGYLLQKSIFN